MIWWVIGTIVGVLLLTFAWFAGSFFYLKLRYRRLPDTERSRFSDLEKEERKPQSGS
jgi:hypothetical protein